jgi:hypothetical protein
MADALRVDVCERSEKLVDEKLDFEDGHDGLHLVEVARSTVDGLWYEFENQVEVDFILL